MKKLILTSLIFGLHFITINAQSYIGHRIDNYSGVHGIILNPSSVVDSRMKTDINILSISAFGGSDYFAIDLSSLKDSEEGFDFEDSMEKNPKEDNQFFLNVDILGPSFMFNLSPIHSLGVTTRVRTFLNLNNINGNLYESLSEDFDSGDNFDFNMENFTGTVHAWGEIGVTYGRILMQKDVHFLKGGVTLKYLAGAGGVFANTPSLMGNYNGTNEILTTMGSLNYGLATDFDTDDIEFKNTTSGFGGDLGFTYEYRNSTAPDSLSKKDNKYKFKLGLSITDIGSISYNDSEVTNYDLNNSVETGDFEDQTIEEFLDENYNGTEQIVNSKINLPTALHFLADYEIRKRIYLSLNGSLSLINEDKKQANRIINTISITPRFETKIFSFYLPMGIRQYDGFSAGAGFRLGPVTIGSASAITTLLSDSSKTADVYIGLKVPIYQ
ncbi:DUF5723 family protein [Christiangramia echinicola]|uniref:DUF5723 domain-containing protein n=1 Tax=Christiangramia echinicola TaxID=279359 RepID=A0A1H1QUE0_9FLAO|nr:DUF5723 family protein [Christiangramia echinicola]SDS26985.1 hypothetical protein SAMN04488552_2639 [Christiangramia echinicola]